VGKLQQNDQMQPGVSSQERVLAALQSVVSHGAATLTQITEELQIPRSSSHRAVQALIDFGWVSKRSGDQAYVLSGLFADQVGVSDFGMHTAESFRPVMTDLREREYLHSELALPDPAGRMRVIESTSKESYTRGEACKLARVVASTIPEIHEHCNSVREAARRLSSWAVPDREKEYKTATPILSSGAHIVGNAACIPFKTEWSEIGVWTIWPVRNFSNSVTQMERIIGHLREGEVFELPKKIDLFYTGDIQ